MSEVGPGGRNCSFAANFSHVENKDEEQMSTDTCYYLCSYRKPCFAQIGDGAGPQNTKSVLGSANVCSQECLRGSVAFYAVPQEGLFPNHVDWKHDPAERSKKEKGSGGDQLSAVRSDRHENVADLSWYPLFEKLHLRAASSSKTTMENGKSDPSGSSDDDESWECSVEFHWLGQSPDLLQALICLGQENRLAAPFDITQRRPFTLFPAGVPPCCGTLSDDRRWGEYCYVRAL